MFIVQAHTPVQAATRLVCVHMRLCGGGKDREADILGAEEERKENQGPWNWENIGA